LLATKGHFFITSIRSFLDAQKKLAKELEILQPFYTTEWTFDTSTLEEVHEKMNQLELERYGTLKFDLYDYGKNCVLGIRKYLMKQKDEDIPKARRRAKFYLLADNVLKMIFWAYIFYFILSLMRSIYN
jgi:alcohol-forming fatty acyl-CoA reductase